MAFSRSVKAACFLWAGVDPVEFGKGGVWVRRLVLSMIISNRMDLVEDMKRCDICVFCGSFSLPFQKCPADCPACLHYTYQPFRFVLFGSYEQSC
jgi:hypothetical protein